MADDQASVDRMNHQPLHAAEEEVHDIIVADSANEDENASGGAADEYDDDVREERRSARIAGGTNHPMRFQSFHTTASSKAYKNTVRRRIRPSWPS